MVRSISRNRIVRTIFTKLAPIYDELDDRITHKQGDRWRDRMIAEANVQKPHRILDACAGTGLLTLKLAQTYGSHCHVVAIDFCPAMLGVARQRFRTHNLQRRVEFKTENIEIMPFPDEFFDGVFVALGMRFVSDIRTVLKECRRVLRSGGRLAVLELALPPNRAVRAVAHWRREHFLTWRNWVDYKMPASLSHALYDPLIHYPDADKLGRMLLRAGYENVRYRSFRAGQATLHTATRIGGGSQLAEE